MGRFYDANSKGRIEPFSSEINQHDESMCNQEERIKAPKQAHNIIMFCNIIKL
jgi:hypothetical protein